jgi:NAD(P)-dependent dehydrogenase (short-subunit alcohol dehydrogenase family)
MARLIHRILLVEEDIHVKFHNKVVVVTGGGNGIGRELVLGLLAHGARVAAIDISQSALEETLVLSGNKKHKLTIHVVNITDKGAVETLPAQIIAQHGAVDGLINNAGIIQPFVKLADLDYETIERVMDVNYYGMLYMIKAFLGHLMTRPEAHLINISSMGGFLPFPGQAVYGASKAAVKLMTEGLYTELLNTSVQVTVVFPGAIGSNILKNSGVAVSPQMEKLQKVIKPMKPTRAARIIIRGAENDRYRILVGLDAVFLDFLYKFSPKRSAQLLHWLMKSLLSE